MAKKKRKREEAGFDQSPQTRRRLTPVDVQEKVFRTTLGRRGYNEQDVDEFLDQITEELALLHEENKRLKEQVEAGGGGNGDAQGQAAEIVRQAREYAARLRADAERAQPGAGGAGAPTSFLVRERDFLQKMASLIQDHAETLKSEARRAKTETAAGAQAGSVAAGAAGAAVLGAAGGAAAGAHEGEPTPSDSAPQTSGAHEGSPTELEPPGGAEDDPFAPPSAPLAAAPTPSPTAVPQAPPAPSWPAEDTQAHDPLLEGWEGGVAGGPAEEPYQSEGDLFAEPEGEPKPGEEPSLRELFWGEE